MLNTKWWTKSGTK